MQQFRLWNNSPKYSTIDVSAHAKILKDDEYYEKSISWLEGYSLTYEAAANEAAVAAEEDEAAVAACEPLQCKTEIYISIFQRFSKPINHQGSTSRSPSRPPRDRLLETVRLQSRSASGVAILRLKQPSPEKVVLTLLTAGPRVPKQQIL